MAKILNSDIQILIEEKTEESHNPILPKSHNEDANHQISFDRKNQEISSPNSFVSQYFMAISINYFIFSPWICIVIFMLSFFFLEPTF